jgi:hypothetical protein
MNRLRVRETTFGTPISLNGAGYSEDVFLIRKLCPVSISAGCGTVDTRVGAKVLPLKE